MLSLHLDGMRDGCLQVGTRNEGMGQSETPSPCGLQPDPRLQSHKYISPSDVAVKKQKTNSNTDAMQGVCLYIFGLTSSLTAAHEWTGLSKYCNTIAFSIQPTVSHGIEIELYRDQSSSTREDCTIPPVPALLRFTTARFRRNSPSPPKKRSSAQQPDTPGRLDPSYPM